MTAGCQRVPCAGSSWRMLQPTISPVSSQHAAARHNPQRIQHEPEAVEQLPPGVCRHDSLGRHAGTMGTTMRQAQRCGREQLAGRQAGGSTAPSQQVGPNPCPGDTHLQDVLRCLLDVGVVPHISKLATCRVSAHGRPLDQAVTLLAAAYLPGRGRCPCTHSCVSWPL